MAYKALSLRTYGVLFLSIAYQVRMNGVYLYRGVCTAYELHTDYAPCAAVALPLRRCCVVEYFAALHEYLLYVNTTIVGKRHIFSCSHSFHSHGPGRTRSASSCRGLDS